MSRHAVRRSLLLAPLSQHKGRFALSVLAIALGVALGYAVQLINHAAISEFAAAVQTLSGEADLAVRGPRAGFDESLYPRLARLPDVAVASPVLEVDAKLVGRREALKIFGLDIFRAARAQERRRAFRPGGPARAFAAGRRSAGRSSPAAICGHRHRRGAGDLPAPGFPEPHRPAAAPGGRCGAPG